MTGWGRRCVRAPGRSATRGERQPMLATAAGHTTAEDDRRDE
jgi:hypothetical protein